MDEALKHHGIKGMRWGVRRTNAQLARASGGKGGGEDDSGGGAKKTGSSGEKPI